jgi:hypothetical protein
MYQYLLAFYGQFQKKNWGLGILQNYPMHMYDVGNVGRVTDKTICTTRLCNCNWGGTVINQHRLILCISEMKK